VAKKNDEALTATDGQNNKPATTTPKHLIMALQEDNASVLPEIIAENFGVTGLRINNLDKIALPAGGGIAWEVPTLDGEPESAKELVGVIVAWEDKKAWWEFALDDPDGTGGGNPPTCQADDLTKGAKGDPTKRYNEKEEKLIESGKAQRTPTQLPGGYWDCNTCVHNMFGSARKGEGKDCKDMRALVLLTPDAVLPMLIRVPATSLAPVKKFFQRLGGRGKRFYGTVVGLSLEKDKNDAGISYSKIVTRAIRFLSPEEIGAARAYKDLFQPMLKRDGTVDALLQLTGAPSTVDNDMMNVGDSGTPANIRNIPPLTDAQLAEAERVAQANEMLPIE
jgi:hypothetical protein